MSSQQQGGHKSSSRLHLQSVRENLAQMITKKARLLLFEKPLLEARYQTLFGKKLHDLFDKKILCLKMTKEIELLKSYYSPEEIPELLESEFCIWDERGKELFNSYEKACRFSDSEKEEACNDEFCQKVNLVVLNTHPDVNPAVSSELRKLWDKFDALAEEEKVDEAYEILEKIAKYPAQTFPQMGKTEETRYLAQLEDNLADLSTETYLIQSKFPFNIQEKFNDSNWLSERNEAIDGEMMETESQLKTLVERREELQKLRSR